MKMHRIFLTVTAALALFTFQSCQKSDTNALQEAQYCLNKASAGTAKACVAGIASNVSAYSKSLKCAAIFISEGFGSASSLATALDSINSAAPGGCAGGCSSTINTMSTFKFSSGGITTPAERAVNNATAADAFAECSASGVKSYVTISSLFKIGTLTSMIAYGLNGPATPTAAELETAIASMDNATVGDLVITTSAAVCADTTNASAATKAYCAELATALASPTATPAGIGACMKAKLANPAAVCT